MADTTQMILKIKFGTHSKKIAIGDLTLQPFILQNGIIIITKKSINRFFGQASKTDWLNEFMHSFSRYGIGATGLLHKLSNPIVFESIGKDGFPSVEEGYALDTIIEACQFLIFAREEGFLSVIELKFAKSAQLFLSKNQKSPIEYLIHEITGYNFTKSLAWNRITSNFVKHPHDSAYRWVEAFPDEFWTLLLDHLQTDWNQIIENPYPATLFIRNWIFSRLPDSLFDVLRTQSPKRSYRSKKAPQNKENAQLSAYVHGFIALYDVSEKNLSILDQLFSKRHPVCRNIEVIPMPVTVKLTPFELELQKTLSVVK